MEWSDFFEDVKKENSIQHLVFDPITASFRNQVDLAQLRKIYGDGKTSDSSTVCTIS